MDYAPIVSNPKLVTIPFGKVNFTSGKVVVMDALTVLDAVAFTKSIKPGAYEVEVLMWPVADYHVVAFARLKIKKDNIKTWEVALTEDLTEKQLSTLKKGKYFGFEVKSELASIADFETTVAYGTEMSAYWKKYPEKNFYTDFLAKEFAKSTAKNKYSSEVGDWNIHKVAKSKEIAMFSSGAGKGYFPSYWGLNESGEIVELLVDFMVVTEKSK